MGTQGITTMAAVVAWFDGDGVFDPALRYFYYDEDRNRVYEIDTYVAGTPGSPAIPEGPSRDETYIRTLDDRLEFDSQNDFPHPNEARLNTIYYDRQERSSYLVEVGEVGSPGVPAGLSRTAIRDSVNLGSYAGVDPADPQDGTWYYNDDDTPRILYDAASLAGSLNGLLNRGANNPTYWLGNPYLVNTHASDLPVAGSEDVRSEAAALAFVEANPLADDGPTLYFDADEGLVYQIDGLRAAVAAVASIRSYKLHALSPRIEVALPALARVPSADGAATGLDVLLASQDIPASLTSRAITNDDLAELGGTATDWGGILAADPAQPGAGENGILYYNSTTELLRWANADNGWRTVMHNRGAFHPDPRVAVGTGGSLRRGQRSLRRQRRGAAVHPRQPRRVPQRSAGRLHPLRVPEHDIERSAGRAVRERDRPVRACRAGERRRGQQLGTARGAA